MRRLSMVMTTLNMFFCWYFVFVLTTTHVQTVSTDNVPKIPLHPVVNTTCGRVLGLELDGAYSFRGIPYAVPPVKNLRWSPPVPLCPKDNTCWKGVYMAQTFPNSCYQRNPLNTSVSLGSEDCLYLNVWTPTLDAAANLSVMVWIHGGNLCDGNGNYPTYAPTEMLAKETNVVYVSMNYRLHAFGFMALDVLSKSSPTGTSGNYGFMDQILAMKWVQTNIRGFGGDPSKVTVFGQSSGGTSIFALLASPMADGLFHKAWILSASPVLNKTSTEASKDNEVFVENTNCSGKSVDCIRALTAEQVTRYTPWDVYPNWGMEDQTDIPTRRQFYGALATVDGYVVPEAPFVTWAKKSNVNGNVPVLIGTTAQECDASPVPEDINTWTWNQYEAYVRKKLSAFGPVVTEMALNFYPSGSVTPEYQYTSMVSDMRVGCGNDILSMIYALNSKSSLYRYVVTSIPSKPVHVMETHFPSSYSFHMWDAYAFFGSIGSYIKPPSPSDVAWQMQMRTEVLSFITTGRPASDKWLPYPSVTALLSDNSTFVSGYKSAECEFWNANGFFSYSWIN